MVLPGYRVTLTVRWAVKAQRANVRPPHKGQRLHLSAQSGRKSENQFYRLTLSFSMDLIDCVTESIRSMVLVTLELIAPLIGGD